MKRASIAYCLLSFVPVVTVLAQGVANQAPAEIKLSPQLRAQTKRVLVRNRANGRQVMISFEGSIRLSPNLLRHLSKEGQDALEIEYGLVYSGAERRTDPGFSEIDSQLWHRSSGRLARDGYFVEWLEVRPDSSSQAGNSVLVLEQKSVLRDFEALRAESIAKAAVAKNQAERERLEKQQARLKALLLKANGLVDEGWKALGQRGYDRSLKLFDEVLTMNVLTGEAEGRAYFGRGLSQFHQNGCVKMESDFARADERTEFRDDIRYYRALCEIEQDKVDAAEEKLRALVSSNHPQYSDAARFYLGVAAEKSSRFDDAESAYLDTIDFSKDERLVGLAKDQLAQLKRKQAQHRYANKIVSALASLGVGYDTNVLALPASVTPADVDLSTKGSGAYQGLASLDVKNPWLFPLKHRVSYALLNIGYFDEAIAAGNNLISHDFGTSVEWVTPSQDAYSIVLGHNLNYLGEWGATTKYLGVTSLRVDLSRIREPQGALPRVYGLGLRLSHFQPHQPASSPELRTVAAALAINGRIRYQSARSAFGPNAEVEYKKATGSSNSYIAASVNGNYEHGLGPEDWQLSASADVGIAVNSYYESAAKRLDTNTKYGASLAKLWSSYLESRVQLSGNSNFSNESSYRYDRFQLNFLTSAFF